MWLLIKAVFTFVIILGVVLSVAVMVVYGIYRIAKAALRKTGEKLKNKNQNQKEEIEYGLTPEMKSLLYRRSTPVGKANIVEGSNEQIVKDVQLELTIEDATEIDDLEDLDDKGLSAETLEIIKQKQKQKREEILKALKQEESYNDDIELEVSKPNQAALDLLTEYRTELTPPNEFSAEYDITMEEPPFIPNPEDYIGPADNTLITADEILALTTMEPNTTDELKQIEHRLQELGEVQGIENLKEISQLLVRQAQIQGDFNKVEELKKMYAQELVMENDELTLDDFKGKKKYEIPLEDKFLKYATAKMEDNQEGKQIWSGKVIGIAEDYIHFYDGTRRWIRLKERINEIKQGDMITLDVELYDKEVQVGKIEVLERVIH